jgi:hypothetical protein
LSIAGGETRMRSFAAEGAIFWLVVVAAVEITASTTPAQYATEGIIFGVLNLVIAYFCWTKRKTAFLVAVAIGLITAIGAYPYPQPLRTVNTPFGAEVDALVILGSLFIVLFGTRAYREARYQSQP